MRNDIKITILSLKLIKRMKFVHIFCILILIVHVPVHVNIMSMSISCPCRYHVHVPFVCSCRCCMSLSVLLVQLPTPVQPHAVLSERGIAWTPRVYLPFHTRTVNSHRNLEQGPLMSETSHVLYASVSRPHLVRQYG